MRISSQQATYIAALNAQHKEEIVARAEMRAAIEAEYHLKLEGYRQRKAMLMIEALDAGIPKSQLGRAIGTTDWKTIQDMLDLGRKLRPVVEIPRERFEGVVVYWMNETDVILAITDLERPHQFVFAGDSRTYEGWKVALNVATGEPQVLLAGMELPPSDDAVLWALDNWKTLPKAVVDNPPTSV